MKRREFLTSVTVGALTVVGKAKCMDISGLGGTNRLTVNDNHKRYWVGSRGKGVGKWNDTKPTGWSYTPNGPGNAPIPTAEDDVIIIGEVQLTGNRIMMCSAPLNVSKATGRIHFESDSVLNIGKRKRKG